MMRRLTYTLLLSLLMSFPLSASHIVGGEIELIHVGAFIYRVNLIYYFDVANNEGRIPERDEPSVELTIFRKSDNTRVRSIILQWVSKIRVPYTQQHCSQGEVVTDKMLYTTFVTLSAEQYSDEGGYYIIWARCCRNYTIGNIFSQDPTHAGAIGAGQTFYTEFPAVTVNGQRFINSTPRNFPALNDYACPAKPYYVDFAGEDTDGDSLVYSLVTPLSTVTVTPAPPPTPGPYPTVTWKGGHGLDHIVNVIDDDTLFRDLKISKAGFLTVTPQFSGLYVFCVRVEEFRHNVKIGEVRRDFQLLVTDCKQSVPPLIIGKKDGDAAFKPVQLNVSYANTVKDEERCIIVNISDKDSERPEDLFLEKINLNAIALNFESRNLLSILPAPSNGVIVGRDSIEFRICLGACPYLTDRPYEIGIIAYDDACALPLTDTLKVVVDIEPPQNDRVKFITPDAVDATLNEGEKATWDFEAHDPDGDSLVFFALDDGFSIAESGMRPKVISNQHGILKGQLEWDAFCDIYDFTKRTDFVLKLLVDDLDKCSLNQADTTTFDLSVLLPGNAFPIIDTDLTSDPAESSIGVIGKKIFESLTFNVTGQDLIDNDQVALSIWGDGFSPGALGMSFPPATAAGSVSSTFTWPLNCEYFNLEERSEFNIGFVVIDSTGKCRQRLMDSLVVKVKILPPSNIAPQISIANLNNEIAYDNGHAVVVPGESLKLQLNVSDGDTPKDRLSIDLIDAGGDAIPDGYSFQAVAGPSVLSSLFTWEPQCSIFRNGVYENDFYFDFRYADDHCASAVADTIRVNVKVKDRESGSFEISPPNVFTPNGDTYNDYYSMERRDASGNLVNILPPDNCLGVFEGVRIYNRWGRLVFTSNDRNFRWLGLEEAAGVYFFHVVYSNRTLKGTVSLRD